MRRMRSGQSCVADAEKLRYFTLPLADLHILKESVGGYKYYQTDLGLRSQPNNRRAFNVNSDNRKAAYQSFN